MMKVVGTILAVLGIILLLTWIILSLYVCLLIIASWTNLLFAVVSLVIFPAVMMFVPVIEYFTTGNWIPLFIVYGGAIISYGLFIFAGYLIERSDYKTASDLVSSELITDLDKQDKKDKAA